MNGNRSHDVIFKRLLSIIKSLDDELRFYPKMGKGHIVLVPIQMIGIVVSVTFCFRDLTRSDRIAGLLALSKSNHGVSGSNPADGEILSEAKRRFIALGLSCLPFHCPDMTEIRLKGT